MSIHAYGYEGEVEEMIPVMEYHRAECNECDWQSELFGELDWQSAEQAAVEHAEEEHAEEDEDEE